MNRNTDKHHHDTQPKVGETYDWPGWDKKVLGDPPKIRVAGEPGSPPSHEGAAPSSQDVEALNKVLENMAKLAIGAKQDGPGTWKGDLKELSGVTVDIYTHDKPIAPLNERDQGNVALRAGRASIEQGPVTIETTHGPVIAINPKTWVRYPVEGNTNQFAFATPEQVLMHETRHYLANKNYKHDVAVRAGMLISTDEKGHLTYEEDPAKPIPDVLIPSIKQLFNAHDEATAEKNVVEVTDKAMKSIDPNYKPIAYGAPGGSLLLEEKNGLPKVEATDQSALIDAAKRSGRSPDRHSELAIDPFEGFTAKQKEVIVARVQEVAEEQHQQDYSLSA